VKQPAERYPETLADDAVPQNNKFCTGTLATIVGMWLASKRVVGVHFNFVVSSSRRKEMTHAHH
jgi:hypothetical protein